MESATPGRGSTRAADGPRRAAAPDGAAREELRRRLHRRQSDLQAASARLDADRRRGDRGDFFEVLRPYLPRLRALARHEIRIAQLEGRSAPGAVAVGDLLDELLVRAWDRFDQRPPDQPLDSWLVGLLYEVADDLLRSDEAPMDVDEPLDAGDARFAVADGWAADAREPTVAPGEHGVTVEELLVDQSTEGNPDVFVTKEELDRLVEEALRGESPERRRAFALAIYDGWSVGDIAALQHRSPDAVRADLERVRSRIRPLLAARARTGGGSAPSPAAGARSSGASDAPAR